MALVNAQGHYLKVIPNMGTFCSPAKWELHDDIIGEDGTVTPVAPTYVPGQVKFVVAFEIFKSKADRIASETDEFIKGIPDTDTFMYEPELPQGWTPKNPLNIELEKKITKVYICIKAKYPEYSDEL